MSGICSRHREKVIGCRLCGITTSDLLFSFDEKLNEAKEAGLHKCSCGFMYYLTINYCPKCNRERQTG